jgi:hypothetical protein
MPYVQRVPENCARNSSPPSRSVTSPSIRRMPRAKSTSAWCGWKLMRLRFENKDGATFPKKFVPSVSLLFNSVPKMKTHLKKFPAPSSRRKAFWPAACFATSSARHRQRLEQRPKRDLALIVSEVPATVAGMFTTNQVCAAPVKVCVERVKKGVAQASSSIPAMPTPAPANRVWRTRAK